MSHTTPEHNPFMLLVHPEAVFAAMEKSERLGRLNRHLCRPLDRQIANQPAPATTTEDGESDDEPLDTLSSTQ